MIINLCIAVIAFQIIGCNLNLRKNINTIPFSENIILIDSSNKHHVIIGKGEHIRSKGILEKTFEVDFEIEKIKNSDNYFWKVKIATTQENCTEKINIIRFDNFIIENNDKIEKYIKSITKKRNKINLIVKSFLDRDTLGNLSVGINFIGFYKKEEIFNQKFELTGNFIPY